MVQPLWLAGRHRLMSEKSTAATAYALVLAVRNTVTTYPVRPSLSVTGGHVIVRDHEPGQSIACGGIFSVASV